MTVAFETAFTSLTGNSPFPWQEALYERFLSGDIPASCNLPTGLGKTSVIAIWLIALANGTAVPRRLVYVVNRRTVVDQTTDEVEKYRTAILEKPELLTLRDWLGERGLALSTLRGQFADNREWSADPSRPAVICGTVDMIGSRLLFNGYGVGWKSRPLHAGFLGQDALLIHDEAHLEPAFQELLLTIEKKQKREREGKPDFPWSSLRVMELTATRRGTGEVFELTAEDQSNAVVNQRVHAKKALRLEPLRDSKKLAEQLAEEALKFKDQNRAVLVFARTVEDVIKIRDKLPKGRVETLTGTLRGKERDELVEKPIFRRFMPGGQSEDETSYLVCTSAGEVGVNLSADHLVCDLTPFDSMAQRFGRVNRFGSRTDSEICVVYSTEHKDAAYQESLERTLQLLHQLDGDASPAALSKLDKKSRQDAFTPRPNILPATDILFDAWALTTVRDKLPGRPPVEPYLHGLPTDWQPPETLVAWREEVEVLNAKPWIEWEPKEFVKYASELLEAYPLKPHELLKEPSYRAFKHFEAMAKRMAGTTVPVWLLDDDGKVEVLTLAELADKDNKDRINGMTVLLPPSIGGLDSGMLNGTAPAPKEERLDVADEWFLKDREGKLARQRKRLLDTDPNDDPEVEPMHSVAVITFPGADEDAEERTWEWFVLRNEGDKSARSPVLWHVHVGDVEREAKKILDRLHLPDELRTAIELAAEFHDHGKKRKLFQAMLGNRKWPERMLAKSGKKSGRLQEQYRHEFGSLLDVMDEPEFKKLSTDVQDLVLHLIATHHGRGRPHFPADEVFDPMPGRHESAQALAAEVPRRFARLQRKYGRWGLAYLESLLRAADWAASAAPSKYETEGDQ